MVNTEIISEWLKKADEDFQFALVNLKEKGSSPESDHGK